MLLRVLVLNPVLFFEFFFFSCSLSPKFQTFAPSFPQKNQVLVGESLVKQTDPATGIARLFGKDISRRDPLATNA